MNGNVARRLSSAAITTASQCWNLTLCGILLSASLHDMLCNSFTSRQRSIISLLLAFQRRSPRTFPTASQWGNGPRGGSNYRHGAHRSVQAFLQFQRASGFIPLVFLHWNTQPSLTSWGLGFRGGGSFYLNYEVC
jgi:hypothetical protein